MDNFIKRRNLEFPQRAMAVQLYILVRSSLPSTSSQSQTFHHKKERNLHINKYTLNF